jgi:hypothetical protein
MLLAQQDGNVAATKSRFGGLVALVALVADTRSVTGSKKTERVKMPMQSSDTVALKFPVPSPVRRPLPDVVVEQLAELWCDVLLGDLQRHPIEHPIQHAS